MRNCLTGGFFLAVAFSFLCSSAHAQSPTEQYLTQRRAAHLKPGITLSLLAQNPSQYSGTTIEIEGQIPGIAADQDGSGGATLLLTTATHGTLMLHMSLLPTWLSSGARVRALCIVAGTPENATRIGLPDLEVIAVASAADITAAEARWKLARDRRDAQFRAADEARRRQVAARQTMVASAPVARGVLPSRGLKKNVTIELNYSALSPGARAVFPAYQSYIQKHNKRLSETQANEITYAILRFSEEMDFDPRLIVATVIAESDFRIQERSHAGAMGLIQLMPDEVERLKLTNPYDPLENIAGGIFLLKERLNKYSGSANFKDANLEQIILALASYNAGEGAVKKYKGVPPYRETQGYVKKIMKIYAELTAGDRR